MNTHPHEEQLSAYLDDGLDLAQTREVARHLALCPACRRTLEALGETKTRLRGLAALVAPGPDFWAASYRRLRVEEGTARRPSPWETIRRGLRGTPRRWAAGLAVAVTLVAAAVTPLVTPAPIPAPPAVAESDFVDVSSLVRAHAATAARQPLADPDRQTMIAADVDDFPELGDSAAEAGGNATVTDAGR